MEQWISIETANFAAARHEVHPHHAFNHPQSGRARGGGQGIEAALTVMDVTLAKTPFLAGTTSASPMSSSCLLEYGMRRPVKEMLAKYPHANACEQGQ